MFDLKRNAEATHAFEEAFTLARAVSDEELEDMVANQLGVLGRLAKDYPAARRYFQRNLEIARAHGNLRFQAIALLMMAVVAGDQDHHQEAIPLLDQAEQLARRAEQWGLVGRLLMNKGHMYFNLRRYDAALAAYRASEPLLEREHLTDMLQEVRVCIANAEEGRRSTRS